MPIKTDARGKLPFSVVSSSVETGYAAEISSSFSPGYDIVNLHGDGYGGLENEPVQGPFTNAHVGGNQHRHIPLNTGTDDASNRAEAFKINLTSSQIRIYGPDYVDTAHPRASFLRGNSAKSPINIKNIQTTTGSSVHGNYRFKYETVQTSGRKLNNFYFVDNDGVQREEVTSSYISYLTESILPERSVNKTVIVERFNAPGGLETSGRGVLDPEAEEYAANNNINVRNIGVRAPLQELLTAHTEQFGLSSLYAGSGSYHKVHRNTLKRLSGSTEVEEYDNWYVQHEIPQNDLSYAWITASAITTAYELGGHQRDGAYSNRAGAFTDITFVSSSKVVSGSTEYDIDFIGISAFDKNDIVIGIKDNELVRDKKVMYFDGSGDYALVQELSNKIVKSDFSFCCWVKPTVIDSSGQDAIIAFNGASSENRLVLVTVHSDDKTRVFDVFDVNGFLSTREPTTFPVSGYNKDTIDGRSWYFVSVTYSKNDNKLSLYINGQIVGYSLESALSSSNGLVSTDLLSIGQEYDGGLTPSDYYNGYISEISIWDDVLTAKEIRELYLTTRNINSSVQPKNLYEHRLDKKYGNCVSWYTGNIKNGYLIDSLGNKNATVYGNTYSQPIEENISFSTYFNGPYQHSSWKQIRNAEHPVVRKLKNSNTISVIDESKEIVLETSTQRRVVKPKRSGTVTNYIEPPVSNKYKPILHDVILKDAEELGGQRIAHTYANNLILYGNKDLSKRIGVSKIGDQVYDKLTKFVVDPNLPEQENPINKVLNIIYSETVWPKEQNTFLNKTRRRNQYIIDKPGFDEDGFDKNFGTQRVFWRDEAADRLRSSGSYLINEINSLSQSARNCFGYPYGLNHYNDTSSLVVSIPEFLPTGRSCYPFDTIENTASLLAFALDGHNTGVGYEEVEYLFVFPGGGELSNLSLRCVKTVQVTGSSTAGYIVDKGTKLFSISNKNVGYEDSRIQIDRTDIYNECVRPSYISPNSIGGFYYETASMDVYGLGSLTISASLFDAGLNWRVAEYAGKNPWYDSYEDYSSDISSVAKDYSIIPEFRISNHLKYYVKDSGGNFRAKNKKLFEIDGSGIRNVSSFDEVEAFDDNYFSDYVHSDTLRYKEKIEKENQGIVKQDNIKIKCKGVKKLLPYNGFYPVNRTVQLANLFSSSFSENLISVQEAKFSNPESGIIEDAYKLHTFLQPFFAPGIVYNTIKSGIAVDWPLLANVAPNYVNPQPVDIGTFVRYDPSAGSITNGPFSGRKVYDDSAVGANRITFESVINPRFSVPKSTMLDYTGSIIPGVLGSWVSGSLTSYQTFYRDEGKATSWNHISDNLYEMASSNFFAEIARFFLKQGKLTAFYSKPVTSWKTFEAGKTYYMDIELFKTDNLVMIESYGALTSSVTGVDIISGALGEKDSGRYFGWPYSISSSLPVSEINPVVTRPIAIHAETDPSYAPFTPPYHEGKAIARLSFTPTESRKYGYDELVSLITASYINSGLVEYRGTPAHAAAMNLSSSVNIFGKTRKKEAQFNLANVLGNQINGRRQPSVVSDSSSDDNDIWVISPKMETPVLDFSEQEKETITNIDVISTTNIPDMRVPGWYATPNSAIEEVDTVPDIFDIGYGRGMWSGYGKIPSSQEGIYLSLRESFSNIYDIRNSDSGSLIKHLGFETKQQKIGQLAESKEISEAIVAIPFVDNKSVNTTEIECHHFFKINKKVFDMQRKNILNGEAAIKVGDLGSKEQITDTSISDMIKLMDNYVIPPHFNFLEYNDIDPFVMYILEFKHTLDQQDLSDIWQGVMPKIAMSAEKDEIEISHPVGKFEFFGEKGLPDNVRWMIFKVKKKAEKNYFAITADSTDDDRFQFDFEIGRKAPEYSYNWPYDYFSLVELAKVEVELKFSNENKEEKLVQGVSTSVPKPVSGQIKPTRRVGTRTNKNIRRR